MTDLLPDQHSEISKFALEYITIGVSGLPNKLRNETRGTFRSHLQTSPRDLNSGRAAIIFR